MFFFSCGRKSSLPANSLFTASTVVLFVLLKIQDAPSLFGKIFAGLGIASGSGGVFELLKAIKSIGNTSPDESQAKPPICKGQLMSRGTFPPLFLYKDRRKHGKERRKKRP
jgi:hypothetical protein